MKKTVISLLLVMTMVLSFVLAAAPTAEAAAALHPHDSATPQTHCSCGNAADSTAIEGHTHDSTIQWQAWTGRPAAAGHYYLTEDLTVTSSTTSDNPLYFTNENAVSFTLCLNGYNINMCQRIYIRPNTTVTFCDCSSTPGTYTSTYVEVEGHGNTAVVRGGAVLNIFDINICYNGTSPAKRGGNLYIEANGKVNMYSGTISGGKTYHSLARLSDGLGSGGNVCVRANGIFNLYGGTISGGTAAVGGSNIYGEAGATVNFAGGKIISGTTDGYDVYVAGEGLKLDITKMGLEVKDSGSVGVGYITGYTMTDGMKAKLTASDACKTKENVATSYGLKLWTEGGTPVYSGYADTEAKEVRAYLANIMDGGSDDAASAATEVKGAAYAVIGETVVESQPRSFTLKTLVEKMDSKLSANESAMAILADLYKVYETTMTSWTIPNIKAKAA